MSKTVESKVVALIEAPVQEAGYELVRVRIKGGGKHATLQIMAERTDGVGMTVDDCAAISGFVAPLLEADPDLAEKFALEVSSPGIDRPLVRLKDFERYKGFVAKIELKAPKDGQRRFQGAIESVSGETIALAHEKGVAQVLFTDIEQAKLVLTDELLKAAERGDVSH